VTRWWWGRRDGGWPTTPDGRSRRSSGGSKQFLTEFLGPADLMSHERMVVLATGQGKAAETAACFTCDRRR
jgi:hypothetical protein